MTSDKQLFPGRPANKLGIDCVFDAEVDRPVYSRDALNLQELTWPEQRATHRYLHKHIERDLNIELPFELDYSLVIRPVTILAGAAMGQPIGTGIRKFVSPCHNVSDRYPHLLKSFSAICDHFGHSPTLTAGWHAKLNRYKMVSREAIASRDPDPYRSDSAWRRFAMTLYPSTPEFRGGETSHPMKRA